MGQKEGVEREKAHCLHNDRICGCHDRGKDGIHLPMVWWVGNISDAFAGVPCLTPFCRALLHIDFRTIKCLRYHYPPSRADFARRAVEEESCPSRIPGIERLSAHA